MASQSLDMKPSIETSSTSPVLWPATKKWKVLVTASIVCFAVGINATAILSAADEISAEFHIDLEIFDYSFFLVTAWNAGAAILPLILLPAMEDFGVRKIYIPVYTIFIIFVMVQAVAPNFATLIVARVISGSCGGVLQNAIDGMAADMWADNSRRLAQSMTMFIFALLGGVTIGPAIGGGIVKYLEWRWILYIQLILFVAISPFVFFLLHETRSENKGKNGGRAKTRIREALNETVLRSSRMLCTEFVLSSFTLWSSFAFGTVFILTQSVPQVFDTLFGWPVWKSGVVQLAIFVGEVIGVLLCVFQDSIVYPRFYQRGPKSGLEEGHLEKPPQINAEARLYTSIPASFLGLTAGFFIFAWTSSPPDGYLWTLPSLGLLLIGVGIMVIVQAVSTYITEFYGSRANSAVSAIAFGENIFAAFLPLATRTMYEQLGYPWASSLLGFVALVISMAPVVLVIFGARIRSKTKR